MGSMNKYLCLLYLALIIFTFASKATSRSLSLQDADTYQKHEQWMSLHGRVYEDSAEKEARFKIFKDNVAYVESSNSMNKPYKLSINKFADLTNEEFETSRNGFKGDHLRSNKSVSFSYESVTEVPASMDWRQLGAVTPVKHQGQCGSCWAFSAVAATEGINQITTGTLVSLSEQELLDCDTSGGCQGGSMSNAFEFIIENKGLTTDTNYPYNGAQGTCSANMEAAATITGYEHVPANSESALLNAVASQPVSVAIDGSGYDFRFYSSGVFNGQCGTDLNHAVTAVGYGTSDDGTKYWLVKNSWGTEWGMEGYMMMERDVSAAEGLCGIARQASYPTA